MWKSGREYQNALKTMKISIQKVQIICNRIRINIEVKKKKKSIAGWRKPDLKKKKIHRKMCIGGVTLVQIGFETVKQFSLKKG